VSNPENDELVQDFVKESIGHLKMIEMDLLEMKKEGGDVSYEAIENVFRAVHTVKGGSGFFNFSSVSELSLVLEKVLKNIKTGIYKPSQKDIEIILSGIEKLKIMLDDISESDNVPYENEKEQLNKMLSDSEIQSKKKQPAESGENDLGKLSLNENDIKKILAYGHFLYKVDMILPDDLDKNNKSIVEFFSNLNSLGNIVASNLDIENFTDLNSCLISNLNFSFLFSTVLEPDLAAYGLSLPEEKVRHIKIDAKTGKIEKDATVTKKERAILIKNLKKMAEDLDSAKKKLMDTYKKNRSNFDEIEKHLKELDNISSSLIDQISSLSD